MNISSNWECWHDNDPSGTRRKQRSLDAPLGINKIAEQCDKANILWFLLLIILQFLVHVHPSPCLGRLLAGYEVGGVENGGS